MVTQDAGQMWLLERGPKVATSACSPLVLPMLLWQWQMGLGQRVGPAQVPGDTLSHFSSCSGAVGTVPSLPAAPKPVMQQRLCSLPVWEDPGDTGWESS